MPPVKFNSEQVEACAWFEKVSKIFGTKNRFVRLRNEIDQLKSITAIAKKKGKYHGSENARLERVELAFLQEWYQYTRDLVGVARELLRLQNSKIISPFEWTNSGSFTSIRTVDDFLYCRKMNCYEFVHYCGWLAGQQGTKKFTDLKDPRPVISTSPATVALRSKSLAPNPNLAIFGVINTNKIVGHFAKNNNAGYYHAGIVGNPIGNRLRHYKLPASYVQSYQVYHLNSDNRRLTVESSEDVFGMFYEKTYAGRYLFK